MRVNSAAWILAKKMFNQKGYHFEKFVVCTDCYDPKTMRRNFSDIAST